VRALKSILFKGANLSAISSDLAFMVAFTALMLVLASVTLERTL
jgi:hypothetical protein